MPKWEDQANAKGCEYQQGFITSNLQLLDNLWQTLTKCFVCGEIPFVDQVLIQFLNFFNLLEIFYWIFLINR